MSRSVLFVELQHLMIKTMIKQYKKRAEIRDAYAINNLAYSDVGIFLGVGDCRKIVQRHWNYGIGQDTVHHIVILVLRTSLEMVAWRLTRKELHITLNWRLGRGHKWKAHTWSYRGMCR